MSSKSKTGAKRMANVDRYGLNAVREEESVGDISVQSQDEEIDESDVEPLLEGGEDGDSSPPKEWTLIDGSPVFRAGKKNLRLDPRKGRRGNGEDSDEFHRRERIARGEAVTPREGDPDPIVPVAIPVPQIAMVSPQAARRPRATVSKPTTPPKTQAPKTQKPTKSEIAPLPLALLFLAAFLLGAVVLYMFAGTANHTTVAFTGSNENYTTLNEIIGEHSYFKATTARLDALETKFDELSKHMLASFEKQSEAQRAALKQERDQLEKEISNLKISLEKSIAEKIDATQMANSLQPKLEEQKKQLLEVIEALKVRITTLETRPIPTSSGGENIALTELNELKQKVAALTNSMTELKTTTEKVQHLESELKVAISNELSTGPCKAAIVAAINEKIKSNGGSSTSDIDAIVKSVLESNTAIQNTVQKLASLQEKIESAERELERLSKRPTGGDTVPVPFDTSILENRIGKLESAVASLNGRPGGSDVTKADLDLVKNGLQELKTQLAAIQPTKGDVDAAQLAAAISSASVPLVQRIEDLERKLSAATPTTPQTPTQMLEEVRKEVAKEVARRVSAGTSIVGRPDHALFTNGGRPMSEGTGWDKNLAEVGSGMETGSSGWLSALTGSRSINQAPSIVLHPDISPGQCWGFPGSRANYTVQLAYPIIPTAFTIDHIPKSEAINPGTMPRSFTIYGLQASDGFVLGNPNLVRLLSGEYSSDGPTAQTFNVPASSNPSQSTFDAFVLNILDNYGASRTCLYRFRVHGDKAPPTSNK